MVVEKAAENTGLSQCLVIVFPHDAVPFTLLHSTQANLIRTLTLTATRTEALFVMHATHHTGLSKLMENFKTLRAFSCAIVCDEGNRLAFREQQQGKKRKKKNVRVEEEDTRKRR